MIDKPEVLQFCFQKHEKLTHVKQLHLVKVLVSHSVPILFPFNNFPLHNTTLVIKFTIASGPKISIEIYAKSFVAQWYWPIL